MRSFTFALSLLAILAFSNTASAFHQGPPGPPGPQGEQGEQGPPGEAEACTGDSCNSTATGGSSTQGQQQGQVGIVAPDISNDQGQQQGQVGIVAPDISNDQGQDQGQSQVGINEQGQDQDQAQGIFGSGNSEQGQQQGQVGINEQGQSQLGFNEQGQSQLGFNEQGQGQIAAQGQFGYVDSHDVYEAQDRNPVSSAAPVSASACSSGFSAQGVDLGAAAAVTNVYCNLALTAEVAKANGNEAVAKEMVGLMRNLAVADAKGIGGFRTILRSLPILGGNLLRWIF